MSVSQATAAGQGTAEPGSGAGEPQGTAPGGQEQQGGQFNWGLFPSVPEDQRGILEPHIRGIQGYVTQLEQRYAPFKPLIDAGYDGDTISGLMQFTTSMQNNPVETVFTILQGLQQEGVLHSDLDLDAVRAVAEGRELDTGDPNPDILEQPGDAGQGDIPEWGQQLMQQNQAILQWMQGRDQREQQGAQQRALNGQLESLRNELSEAKVDLSSVGDAEAQERYMTALLITHNMDPAAAAQAVTGFRDGQIAGFTQENHDADPANRELDLPQGAPSSRPQRNRGDGFDAANNAARSMLERNMGHSAQGT